MRVHVTPAASIEMISGPREAEVLSTLTLKIGAKDASGRPLLSCANLSLEWTSNEEVCDASGRTDNVVPCIFQAYSEPPTGFISSCIQSFHWTRWSVGVCGTLDVTPKSAHTTLNARLNGLNSESAHVEAVVSGFNPLSIVVPGSTPPVALASIGSSAWVKVRGGPLSWTRNCKGIMMSYHHQIHHPLPGTNALLIPSKFLVGLCFSN